MFDTKSDFALNKLDREAIVCKSVTGVHIRLTCEDFSSKEEFDKWKKWSDDNYCDTETAGRDFYDNCLSLIEAANTTSISAEDAIFIPMLEAELKEQRVAMLQRIRDALTQTQYRRLWMYCVEKKTEAEIAQAENVGQPRVCRSLRRARKILEKIFSADTKTGDKKG